MVSALTLKIICILPGSEMKGPLAPKAVQKPVLIMTWEERKQEGEYENRQKGRV